MRRALKILAWVAGVLLALPLLLIVLVLVLANAGPGRRLIERVTADVTGHTVVLQGLAGRFPDALRLGHFELRDARGAWLAADGLALDWSPAALASGEALIDRLAAERIAVPRLPESTAPAKPSQGGGGGFRLPVRVVLRALHVGRAEIGAPVAGAAATLSLDGHGTARALDDAQVALSLRRLDAPGRYDAEAALTPERIAGTLAADEPEHGLIAALGRLPALGGPISIHGRVEGPRAAEAAELAIDAGPLAARAHGTVDLTHQAADLDVAAHAPAMAPRQDVSWQSVAVDAHVHGPFTAPDATAKVRIGGLAAGGATLRALAADVAGNAGHVGLAARIEGLRIPGPKPDLLEAAPLTLKVAAELSKPDRPVTFSLSHPLIEASGQAETGGDIKAALTLALPTLAPFAAAGGVDIEGRTTLAARLAMAGQATTLDVDGTLGITGGMAPVPALIGPDARIGATATLDGQDVRISRAAVDGRALHVSASGSDRGGALDLAWKLGLPDLSALAASVSGTLDVAGTAKGAQNDLTVAADLSGDVAAKGLPRGPVRATLRASGLPGAPEATVGAEGTLGGAPVAVAAAVKRTHEGLLTASIRQVDWKSAHVTGDFTLPPGALLPLGKADIRIGRLADLRPFVGQPLTGSVEGGLDLVQDGGHPEARLALALRDAGIPGDRVRSARLDARVADPATHPVVRATLAVDGIAASGIGGSARLRADGPEDALDLKLDASLSNLAGADARLAAAARLDVPGKAAGLRTLAADWHGESLRLLAPARISYGTAVAVDRLRLGLGQAVLDVAGKVSPQLALSADLRGVTPALAQPFAPGLAARGTISASARLGGTTAAPSGTVRLVASGMQLESVVGRALPPADLRADAKLRGSAAQLDAHLTAGASRLAVTGDAPLSAAGALALRVAGGFDLGMLDPILTAQGRRARGELTLDLAVRGAPTAPRVTGQVRLARGEVQDYAQGAHVTDIDAVLEAAGDTVRIARLEGRAGLGTIAAAGTVGVLRPGLPVDVTITARNARPLAGNLLTADLDADLYARGEAEGHLSAGGKVHVRRAEVNIPNSLPVSVPVLDVRQPGAAPPPPAAASTDIALDLTVDAPQSVFVRGHGLDSELGGTLHIGGSSGAPQVSGGFNLRRGTFSLAGTNLTFTRGKVGFDGTGVTGKIDPTLDFEADSTTSNGTVVKLLVGGYASKPKITLTSDPPLPQDEVLAQLLFGQSASSLSPVQLAEIASALATITGVGGSGGGPLDAIRNGLGLDRLTVGSGSTQNGLVPQTTGKTTSGNNNTAPTVEAGRYVARGVYVGAKQGTSGSDTQATVQIDITKGLKIETDVGSGRGANNVGLRYQLEY